MRSVFKWMAVVSVMLASAAAWGQPEVVPISGQVINQFGQPLPFATVRICSVTSTGSPCTPVATTYLDYNSTVQTPQNYAADQFGNYTVYAQALTAPNLYEVQLFPASGITWTYVVKGPQAGGGSQPVIEVNGVVVPPSTYNFINGTNTTISNPSGGTIRIDAAGGASLCGSLPGDPTSTNCGTGNLAGNTANHVSTFGFTNLIGNNQSNGQVAVGTNNINRDEGIENVAVGDSNLLNSLDSSNSNGNNIAIGQQNGQEYYGSTAICIGFQNCDSGGNTAAPQNALFDVIAFGSGSVDNAGLGGFSLIGIGKDTVQNGVGYTGEMLEMICMGDESCLNPFFTANQTADDVVALGDSAASGFGDGSFDIVAIGDGADKQCSASFQCPSLLPLPATVHGVVAIGSPAASFNAGSNIVAIGELAMGSGTVGGAIIVGFNNRGDYNTAVGGYAALIANSTGVNNTAIGSFAGSDGFVYPSTWGNSNHTGNNNTWVGYDSGPNTTTQLSNTAAFGFQAHNTASNQIVLGNSSMTQAILFGVPQFPSVLSAPCLGTDGSGNVISNPGCTGGGSFVYPAGTGVVTVVGGAAWGTTLGTQGTDANLLTAGTVSGTGVTLCTDANGGATTSGCASSAPNFSAILPGTNTLGAFHIGSGSTLDTTGAGIINATSAVALASTPSVCGAGQYSVGVDINADSICVPLPTQPASQYIAPQAMSGCGVEYVSGLSYTIGACTYSINGVIYDSPLTNVTLAAADPTNPRIDVIFVDTTQVVQVRAGTPAVNPQQPVVDPSKELQLTFVLVPAASTTPADTTLVDIYLEGVEWTGAKGGTNGSRVNLTSTSNPYTGTHDIEFGVGGTVAATTFAGLTVPSAGTVNLANYNTLTLYARNKAAWAATNSITVQWFNGTTQKGTGVVISNGAFGWNATTNTSAYQQISIPTSLFGIAGVPVTSVRFTVSGTGAALTGFYLDQITLQGGSGGPSLPATLMNFKGPWSATATYNPNDTVTSGGSGYVALATNTNQAVTNIAFWTPLGGAGAGSIASFAAPSVSWPSWLVPSVTNPTGPATSLAVTAGAIPNSALANQVANTVLGALTSTTPSGLPMPPCSGSTNALTWQTSVGFGCNTIAGGGGGNTISTSLTSNFLPKSNGVNSIIDSAWSDDGTTTTYHGSGTVGSFGLNEGTAASGVTGADVFYALAATHRWLMNNNNAGALTVVGIATAGTSGNCVESAANGIDIVVTGTPCGTGAGNVSAGGTLASNALILGAGTTAVAALGSLGTTTTVLHGNAAGAPSFGAVSLANDVTGQLPIAAVGSAGLSGTSPISIASTGAIACTTCVVASSPGVGIAHFAGSTQTVTSSAVSLTADVTGVLPAANIAASLTSTSSVNGTTIPASSTLPVTIASGTSSLGTSSISSASCATVVTTTATGTASTDAIIWNPNASIKAVTGYIPATTGGLTIAGYPTTNAVNWDVCNWTSTSITPGAVTLNWRVVR